MVVRQLVHSSDIWYYAYIFPTYNQLLSTSRETERKNCCQTNRVYGGRKDGLKVKFSTIYAVRRLYDINIICFFSNAFKNVVWNVSFLYQLHNI